MIEGVRPKLDIQISTSKKSSNSITNITVVPFHRAILMGYISSSRMNSKTMACKEISKIRAAIKFTALVHADILILTDRCIRGKEVAKPMNGQSLGNLGITMLDSSEMVSNKNPGGLIIDTNKVGMMGLVLGGHTGKGEMNRKTLVRTSDSLDRIRTTRSLGLLGLDTGRTLVNDRVLGLVSKLGNTIDCFGGIIQVFVTGMSESLVP